MPFEKLAVAAMRVYMWYSAVKFYTIENICVHMQLCLGANPS